MFKYLLLAAFLGLSSCTPNVQKSTDTVLVSPSSHDAKTAPIPPPQPIEVPSQQPAIPQPSASEVVGLSQSYVTVDRAVIDVPRAGEQVVDVPYSPIQLPQGQVNEQAVDYNIPQPVIEVPGPSVQSKPVVFNVPQQVIQVPEPVIRPRPIIYRVPYSLSLQKPVVRHQQIFYKVPAASFVPKSAMEQTYVAGTPVFEAKY